MKVRGPWGIYLSDLSDHHANKAMHDSQQYP